MPIRFFYEEIEFRVSNPSRVKHWISATAEKERKKIKDINYVFCSDKFLLRLNQQYLKHKTLTDIITFDDSSENRLSGEIYISVERVEENAKKFKSNFHDEVHRVMIHGVLHLIGYKDKSETDKILMRKKEEAYLSLWEKLFHVKRSR